MIWLSDHRQTDVVISSDDTTNKHRREATTAAINSSQGRECDLNGAALDFDIKITACVLCSMHTTAL